MTDHGPVFERLIDTFERTSATIDAIEDPELAFQMASRLGDMVREMEGTVAQLRSRQAGRIYDKYELSLAGLADRVSVSKTRAAQMLKEGRGREEGKKTNV